MRLFIAEKPSLGREIAANLGIESRGDGFIRCRGGDVVTWCFGHLYELCAPEDYAAEWKSWSIESLPIIPASWRRKARSDKGIAGQIRAIKKLIGEASRVVNAGDPDREGQLLVDEVLEELGNRKPVDRIWLASLDEKSVRQALATIKPNQQFRGFRDAADARGRADWLVGLNLTRALTCIGRQSGFGGVISAGRVQSPTLALVVQRDLDIESHKAVQHFVPQARLQHGNSREEFTVALLIDETMFGVDSEGRLTDRRIGESILQGVAGMKGTITAFSEEEKRQAPPLPYRLSSLQKAASAKFGFSAKKTLDIAQQLYEDRLTTYPRSDCEYLPEEQFEGAGAILMNLAGHAGVDKADPTRKSKAWHTAKVTAHHAIIPTGLRADLEGDKARVFTLIVEGFVRQFLPDYRYLSQSVTVDMAERHWKGSGTKVLDSGWRLDAAPADENPEYRESLPRMTKGDEASCLAAILQEVQTKPPARFTEGTLIDAMANIHRFVTDPGIKATLKENAGIGTEATRAGIIETLKQRGYIQAKGAQLVSSDLGRQVVEFLPPALKDPGTTAFWEQQLERVSQGDVTVEQFISNEAQSVGELLRAVIGGVDRLDIKAEHTCAECGAALLRRESSKKRGVFYWACSKNFEHPKYGDNGGKPGETFGTSTSGNTVRTNNGGNSAQNCSDNGIVCVHPGCGGQMRRLPSQRKKGVYFWACSTRNHPLYGDNNGRPGEAFRD